MTELEKAFAELFEDTYPMPCFHKNIGCIYANPRSDYDDFCIVDYAEDFPMTCAKGVSRYYEKLIKNT